MRHRLARLGFIGLAAVAWSLPATVAASQGPVSITLNANFGTGDETFTATGAFCAAGSAETSDLAIVGGGRGLSFHLVKTLTCDDGSGTLTISVNAATHAGQPGDQGGWAVMSGTRSWSHAAGGGALAGSYYPGGVIDLYTGYLRS